MHVAVLNPERPKSLGLASYHFARRYFGNRVFFLFLSLLRCFSSRRSLYNTIDSCYSDWAFLSRVPPFGHLRFIGYLLLAAAFRSLSRPSSAPGAKASSLRSSSLDHQVKLPRRQLYLSKYLALRASIFAVHCLGLFTLLFEVILFHLEIIVFRLNSLIKLISRTEHFPWSDFHLISTHFCLWFLGSPL